MSLILCIETATEVCSVALSQNGLSISSACIEKGNSHASQLHILVQHCLQKSGYVLNQMDAIAVSKGPGSYTGLRVGVSAAKGYCYALAIPLIAIDSLTSLTNRFLKTHQVEPNTLLVPMIDARRMEVYTCILDQKLSIVEPIEAKIINEHSYAHLLKQQSLLFFGNGSEKCIPFLQDPHATFIHETKSGAEGLCSLAEIAFENKNFENTAYFEPYYLKDFVGTIPKKFSGF